MPTADLLIKLQYGQISQVEYENLICAIPGVVKAKILNIFGSKIDIQYTSSLYLSPTTWAMAIGQISNSERRFVPSSGTGTTTVIGISNILIFNTNQNEN